MEQNFQFEVLESQIRECFGRLVWTHTTHQKCIDILEKKEKKIKVVQIILNTISATGLITYIFNNQNWIPPISAVLTTIALAMDIYCLNYDIGKEKELHINLVNKLWNIREKYFSLLTDIKIRKLDINEIISKRDKLQEELNEAYKTGIRTNSKAYNMATKALKRNEEMTLHDEEIDMFLPKELRKSKVLIKNLPIKKK